MPSDWTIWRLLRVAITFVLGAGVLILMLLFMGYSMVHHPHPYTAGYRKLYPPQMIELHFRSVAGRQTALYIPPSRAASMPGHLWVAFCGNGSLALDWLPLIACDHNSSDAFLLIDYPGYGTNEGWLNPGNTRTAADDAFAALAAHLGVPAASLEPRLNAIGHSLGAAAALDFAVHNQIGKLILLAPFISLRAEAAGFIGAWLSYLVPNEYDNRAALRELAQRRPLPRVLIFHGLQDELIPSWMGANGGGIPKLCHLPRGARRESRHDWRAGVRTSARRAKSKVVR